MGLGSWTCGASTVAPDMFLVSGFGFQPPNATRTNHARGSSIDDSFAVSEAPAHVSLGALCHSFLALFPPPSQRREIHPSRSYKFVEESSRL